MARSSLGRPLLAAHRPVVINLQIMVSHTHSRTTGRQLSPAPSFASCFTTPTCYRQRLLVVLVAHEGARLDEDNSNRACESPSGGASNMDGLLSTHRRHYRYLTCANLLPIYPDTIVPHNLYRFRWHPLPGVDCPRWHVRRRSRVACQEGSGGGRRQARIRSKVPRDPPRHRQDAHDLNSLQVPLQWHIN